MSNPVIVCEVPEKTYLQEIRCGAHMLFADEPVHMGGGDKAPAPFDFLLMALGSCTSITLRMYAERKGIALTGVRVELSHDKVEMDGKAQDHILRRIHLLGNLDAAQKQRMLEIAMKCPVARTLGQSSAIDSVLM